MVDKTGWTEPLESGRGGLGIESRSGPKQLSVGYVEAWIARHMGRWYRCRQTDRGLAHYGRCLWQGQCALRGRARLRSRSECDEVARHSRSEEHTSELQ